MWVAGMCQGHIQHAGYDAHDSLQTSHGPPAVLFYMQEPTSPLPGSRLELVVAELGMLQSAVRDHAAVDQLALSRLDALTAEVSVIESAGGLFGCRLGR